RVAARSPRAGGGEGGAAGSAASTAACSAVSASCREATSPSITPASPRLSRLTGAAPAASDAICGLSSSTIARPLLFRVLYTGGSMRMKHKLRLAQNREQGRLVRPFSDDDLVCADGPQRRGDMLRQAGVPHLGEVRGSRCSFGETCRKPC